MIKYNTQSSQNVNITQKAYCALTAQSLYTSYTLCLNMVEVELKEWGNSIGVILPSETLKDFGLHKGDKVELEIIAKKRRDGFGICKGAAPFKEEEDSHLEF